MIKQYKYSLIAIFLVIFFSSWTILNKKEYKKSNTVIIWDIISYYAYLPATFIYNDVSLEFTNKNPGFWLDKFWTDKSPIHKNAIKTSMGMAYLYSPFFFIAHYYAKNTSFESNGFTQPYKVSLIISILFYYLLGLFYLFKILKKWFSDKVIAITIICLSFGTNIYWLSAYSAYPMPHIYNFTLFSIFIYYSIKWIERQTYSRTIIIGALIGIISLVRPTNIIIALVLLFWGVTSVKEFGDRIIMLIKQYPKILLMILLFLIIWLPQLFYWKKISGSWLYFSYGNDEGFFFLRPEIINGMFSYRNGWLIYTPIMIFALYGIYLLKARLNVAFGAIAIFTILNIYIILSWWCWWYTGFGNRAFIDSYSILAIPFAVFIEKILSITFFKRALIFFVITLMLILNQIQAYQYTKAIIHWDSMNKDAYWAGFLKTTKPDTLNYLFTSPDYEKAKNGITISLPNNYKEE